MYTCTRSHGGFLRVHVYRITRLSTQIWRQIRNSAVRTKTNNVKVKFGKRPRRQDVVQEYVSFLQRSTQQKRSECEVFSYLAFHQNKWLHQTTSRSVKPFTHCPLVVQSYLPGGARQLIYNALNPEPERVCPSNGISISFVYSLPNYIHPTRALHRFWDITMS